MTDTLLPVQDAFVPAQDATSFADQAPATASPEAAPVAQPQTANGFATLGLAADLVAATTDLGFLKPTEVQARAIPLAMGGEGDRFVDLMVSSRTGSGNWAFSSLPLGLSLKYSKLYQQSRIRNTSFSRHQGLGLLVSSRRVPRPTICQNLVYE